MFLVVVSLGGEITGNFSFLIFFSTNSFYFYFSKNKLFVKAKVKEGI